MTIDFGQLMQPNRMSTVLGAAFMLLFVIMWSRRKELDCTDLICMPDSQGEKRLSLTRIGLCMGIVVAVWAPVFTTLNGKLESDVLGIALAFLGGVEGYSKYLRMKSDQIKATGGTP